MAELDRELRELRVDWPVTPDVAGAVRVAITRESSPRSRRRLPRGRRLLAYAAAALVALLGGAMAVPDARSTILEWLGLSSVRIERREPAVPPAPTTAPGADLGLGERVSEAAAARLADFDPSPPDRLGPPDAVHFSDRVDGGVVSYVYGPRRGIPRSSRTGVGVVVSELIATVTPVIEKAAGPGTRVERLRIDGDRAYRLSGRAHGFAFVDRNGEAIFEPERLAAPALLVERRGLLIRVEGRLSRAEAIGIVRSIRASS